MDFLTAKPLSDTIYDTLFKAEKELIIIAPYIQISGYLRENVLKQHLNNPKLHIIIAFDKYKDNNNTFGFRGSGLEYSMSLLSYPLINSIDFGVFAEKSFNIVGKNNFYETSKNTVMSVIDSGYTVFAKRPLYSKKLLGLSKAYAGSAVYLNLLDDVIANRSIEPIRYSSLISEIGR